MSLLDKYKETVIQCDPIRAVGHVDKVKGILMESIGPHMFVGEMAKIVLPNGQSYLAEATGLRDNRNNLMLYENAVEIAVGARVVGMGESLSVKVGDQLLGRVLDALGRPIDDKGPILSGKKSPVLRDSPKAMERHPITDQIRTGVRAIDAMLPLGKGQRVGIFAGSGVGKSTLLGMIARNSSADVNVIALIGERGREVREFIENDLGPEGLARSVIIVSTGDTSPLARVRGAYTATAVAEYFRDKGQDVMLLFDSVTRFAMSQREIGLANNEPPASRGYTPGVFNQLPKLLERSGAGKIGSITGIYTILVEGDDMEEPIADTVRGILDGHIVLSRALAEQGHFPAIDILRSVSRLASKVQKKEVQVKARKLKGLLAAYRDAEDLIRVGAYVRGSDPEIDEAVSKRKRIEEFLRQDVDEKSDIASAEGGLALLAMGGTSK